MEDDELDINWVEIEAAARASDSRRRGFAMMKRLYTSTPEEFIAWLREMPEDAHFDTILDLLTVAEFFVEANARTLKTDVKMLLTCLSELAENE